MWSDAARAAALLARQRKSMTKTKLAKAFRSVERDLFRARVNYENFSNPDWVKGTAWSKEQVADTLKHSRSIINAHRLLRKEWQSRKSGVLRSSFVKTMPLGQRALSRLPPLREKNRNATIDRQTVYDRNEGKARLTPLRFRVKGK